MLDYAQSAPRAANSRTHLQGTTPKSDSTMNRVRAKRKLQFVQKAEAVTDLTMIEGKSFYLDLNGFKGARQLESDIVKLGGKVEKFLSRDVHCVITNKSAEDLKRQSAGGSQNSPGSQTMPSPSFMTRGRALLQKSVASRGLSCNDVITNAKSWGVDIQNVRTFLITLKHEQLRRADEEEDDPKPLKKTPIKHLQGFYIKFEDDSSQYRPEHQTFTEFPSLCESLFFPKKKNVEVAKTPNTNTCKSRSNMARQRAQSARPKAKNGYCECCDVWYKDFKTHLESVKHRDFIKADGNFSILDRTIAMFAPLTSLLSPACDKENMDPRPQTCEARSRGKANHRSPVCVTRPPSPVAALFAQEIVSLSERKSSVDYNLKGNISVHRNEGTSADELHNTNGPNEEPPVIQREVSPEQTDQVSPQTTTPCESAVHKQSPPTLSESALQKQLPKTTTGSSDKGDVCCDPEDEPPLLGMEDNTISVDPPAVHKQPSLMPALCGPFPSEPMINIYDSLNVTTNDNISNQTNMIPTLDLCPPDLARCPELSNLNDMQSVGEVEYNSDTLPYLDDIPISLNQGVDSVFSDISQSPVHINCNSPFSEVSSTAPPIAKTWFSVTGYDKVETCDFQNGGATYRPGEQPSITSFGNDVDIGSYSNKLASILSKIGGKGSEGIQAESPVPCDIENVFSDSKTVKSEVAEKIDEVNSEEKIVSCIIETSVPCLPDFSDSKTAKSEVTKTIDELKSEEKIDSCTIETSQLQVPTNPVKNANIPLLSPISAFPFVNLNDSYHMPHLDMVTHTDGGGFSNMLETFLENCDAMGDDIQLETSEVPKPAIELPKEQTLHQTELTRKSEQRHESGSSSGVSEEVISPTPTQNNIVAMPVPIVPSDVDCMSRDSGLVGETSLLTEHTIFDAELKSVVTLSVNQAGGDNLPHISADCNPAPVDSKEAERDSPLGETNSIKQPEPNLVKLTKKAGKRKRSENTGSKVLVASPVPLNVRRRSCKQPQFYKDLGSSDSDDFETPKKTRKCGNSDNNNWSSVKTPLQAHQLHTPRAAKLELPAAPHGTWQVAPSGEMKLKFCRVLVTPVRESQNDMVWRVTQSGDCRLTFSGCGSNSKRKRRLPGSPAAGKRRRLEL